VIEVGRPLSMVAAVGLGHVIGQNFRRMAIWFTVAGVFWIGGALLEDDHLGRHVSGLPFWVVRSVGWRRHPLLGVATIRPAPLRAVAALAVRTQFAKNAASASYVSSGASSAR
jgi:hypothetical protein